MVLQFLGCEKDFDTGNCSANVCRLPTLKPKTVAGVEFALVVDWSPASAKTRRLIEDRKIDASLSLPSRRPSNRNPGAASYFAMQANANVCVRLPLPRQRGIYDYQLVPTHCFCPYEGLR
jgi:hypothetical protein